MADPRKPVIQPNAEDQDRIRQTAYPHLIRAAEQGAREIGCSPPAFVMIGLSIWVSELAEVDTKSTSRMLTALATIHDPNANHAKKMRAEKKRRAAVIKLFNAMDIEMAAPAGTA